MKKETIFSILFIIVGAICEFLYLYSDNQLFDAKFAFIGSIALIAGFIGLWLFAILPRLNDE